MWSYMAISNPTTPAQYVIVLLDLVRQRGIDSEQLLAETGIDQTQLARIGGRVDDETFAAIVDAAYRSTGDRALGLHLGQRLSLSAHATVGQAFMTCENLEQVLNFFLKYYRILAPALRVSYDQTDGRCWLTITERYLDHEIEFSHEILFAALLSNIQMLLNQTELNFRMEFPYPEPEHSDEYHRMLGDELYFDCKLGRISFSDEWLDARVPSSNPSLLALYEQECKRLLEDLEDDDTLSEQTLAVLRKLEGHYPQMPQVAEMLAMSPRTYRRRLTDESSSYQQLLDQVRREQATHYLQETRLPLASIAYMVGFNDVSNFRRAYIKWTGQTPREARSHV